MPVWAEEGGGTTLTEQEQAALAAWILQQAQQAAAEAIAAGQQPTPPSAPWTAAQTYQDLGVTPEPIYSTPLIPPQTVVQPQAPAPITSDLVNPPAQPPLTPPSWGITEQTAPPPVSMAKPLMPEPTWGTQEQTAPPPITSPAPQPTPPAPNEQGGTPKPQEPAPAPAPTVAAYDPEKDPIYQELFGQWIAEEPKLRGEALTSKKNVLLGFGSQELAKKVLGENDPFVSLVSDNPFQSTSSMAQINYLYGGGAPGWQGTKPKSFNAQENTKNLWYSGARIGGLQSLGQQKLYEAGNAQRTAESNLSNIDTGLAAAIKEWQNKLWSQKRDLYMSHLPTGVSS